MVIQCNGNLPHEIWRDICGYEGIYQVSNFGRVKSLHFDRERLLKLRQDYKGYVYVVLHKDGECKPCKVHRLVAETFILNSEGKPQVNHIDGNKSNNRVENLEWVTNSENKKHSYENGICKPNCGTKNVMSRLTAADVRYIRSNYIPYDKKSGERALAKRFNVSKTLIGNIIKGKTYRDVL